MREHVEGPAYQPRPSLAELAHATASLGGIDYRAGRDLEHRLIGAGAKRVAFAGHDQHAAIAIVANGLKVTLEVQDDGLIEAVAALGPIEGDRRDRTVSFDEEVFCHAFSSNVAEPTTRAPLITIVRFICLQWKKHSKG